MFDIGSVKYNKFTFKDSTSGRVREFYDINEVCDYILDNENITVKCILDVAGKIDNLEDRENLITSADKIISEHLDSLSKKEIYDFIEKNHMILGKDYVKRLSNKDILKFLKKNKDKLNEAYYASVLMMVRNDKIKLDYLKENAEIDDEHKTGLLNSLESENLLEIYSKNNFDAKRLISKSVILKRTRRILNKKIGIRFLREILPELTTKDFEDITSGDDKILSKEELVKILQKNKSILNSEQLSYEILLSNPKKVQKLYKKDADKLDEEHKQLFNEIFSSSDVKALADKIMQSLGVNTLINPNTIQLISEKGLATFGEESLYLLFKHGVYTDTINSISRALENDVLFKKFLEYRKENVQQNSVEIANLQNAIVEFEEKFELIEDCMNEELTEEENAVFITALSDKKVKVKSKNELSEYAEKRTEHIETLLETDVESAIVYMLTGLDKEEFESKKILYYSDAQLSVALKDFSEDFKMQIYLIKAATECVDWLIKISDKNKKKVLPILIKDLEQEFTKKGSVISQMRNSFKGFAEELKSFYGAELQESLANSALPEPKKEKGVDVIRLEGEEFKILVHGLNAYGKGAAQYANREVGATYVCTSLISNNNINRAKAKIYYGFKNIGENSLALAGSSDIFSYAEENSLDIKAEHNVKFSKSDKILQESKEVDEYNEIVLYRDAATPDYIVAFSKITPREIKESKRLNIPVVLINEQIYEERIESEIEEAAKLDKKQERINDKKIEDVGREMRNIVMDIIDKAADNCTALQQNAIMDEVIKARNLSAEQGRILGGK